MTIEEAIHARLAKNTSLSHAFVAARIHPGYIPDDAPLPAIMFERKLDAEQTIYNIDGTIDHIEATYRINCYAGQESFATANALSRAVEKDLDQYRTLFSDLRLINTWRNSSYSNYDGTNKRQRVTVELEFWYQEITP